MLKRGREVSATSKEAIKDNIKKIQQYIRGRAQYTDKLQDYIKESKAFITDRLSTRSVAYKAASVTRKQLDGVVLASLSYSFGARSPSPRGWAAAEDSSQAAEGLPGGRFEYHAMGL